MRLLLNRRSMRKWILISFIVVVFVIGNFILYKNADGDIKPSRSGGHRPNSDVVDSLGSKVEEVEPTVYTKRVDSKAFKDERKSRTASLIIKPNPKREDGDRPTNNIKAPKSSKDFKYNVAILVIACNRPSVSRCLDQIFKIKPKNINMPVIVSQDCGHSETENVIRSYGNKLKLVKQPDLSDVQGVPGHMLHFMGYYKISRHYKFALQNAFKDSKIDSVIIIEDDLNIAPDFFEYFMATRPLLELDKSLYCISAWNDNGKEGFVKDNKLLYRTDFFPGLGWMLTRSLWQELESKWPLGFWDDWMRNPDQRKNRACIRPEISRSKTFGRVGVSQGQFFDQYLKFIQLSDDFYSFTKADLSYLLKANYDREFIKEVNSKPVVSIDDVLNDSFQGDAVRLQYSSNAEIESLTRQFGLMTDLKAGVPRTAYKGIVSFVHKNRRIYLTPTGDWAGYVEN